MTECSVHRSLGVSLTGHISVAAKTFRLTLLCFW